MNEMNNYNYTPGELISLFIDGELDEGQRELLFNALSGNPDLQADFERALHIKNAVGEESLKTVPPVALTNAIFAEAGFLVSSVATPLASRLGFFKKLFVPVFSAALASIVTIILSYSYFQGELGKLAFKNQGAREIASGESAKKHSTNTQNVIPDTAQKGHLKANPGAISRRDSLHLIVKQDPKRESYKASESHKFTLSVGRPGPVNVTMFNPLHQNKPAQPVRIPTDGLVAHYPFNGNAHDMSGNNFNGVVSGATLTKDRFGNENSAYRFDGFDDYIAVHNASNSKLEPTEEITISCFIYADSSHGKHAWSRIIRKEDSFDNGYLLSWDHERNATLQAFFLSDCIPEQYYTRSDNLNISTRYLSTAWHHIAVTYSKKTKTITMFIDGVNVSSTFNCLYDFQHSDDVLYIGGIAGKQGVGKIVYETFPGIIDDIRIYERALDNNEIQALYYEGSL